MRALFWITGLLATLYAGYWVVGSRAVLNGATEALSELKAEGRADYGAIALKGFPSRFDLTIDTPKLESADGRMTWQAPFIQFLALSYRPHNLIAVWPQDQTVHLDGEQLDLQSDDLRASVTLVPGLDLPLDHSEVEGHGLVLTSDLGWQVLAEKLIVASRQVGADASRHELAIVLTGLAPGNAFRGQIDPARRQPATVQEARLTLTATFDRALDRKALAGPLRILSLEALDLSLIWGKIAASASGDLAIDEMGNPTGQLSLALTNWRDLLILLSDSGVLSAEQAATAEQALANAAKPDDPATVTLPLTFRDGVIWMGFIPLAMSPRF